MTNVNLTLNGKAVSADVPDNTLLVSFIRETMTLTGTHVGCDTSQCGACVVHVNGETVKSCTMLAVAAEGAEVTTIEGIGSAESLHPMQQAFHENHGLQCGFCTPGMVMSAIELVEKNPNPSEQDVRE
ncbi:MAG: (2Fe-2S)-binding protein, partial [Pseudomonadota bacterium]|nr:(2Fe-2S)-binding protein [Pseudomonadota bacterium]